MSRIKRFTVTFPVFALAVTVSLAAVGASPALAGGPSNDNCADATPIGDGDFPFHNFDANSDGPFACEALLSDVWFCYTASCTGTAVAQTCGSGGKAGEGFDTVLAIYNGCGCPVGLAIECNDDFCGLQSLVQFPVVQGQRYMLQVGGFFGEQGNAVLRVACSPEGGTYTVNTCSNELEDLSQVGTLGTPCDDCADLVNLGFNFPFYGSIKTSVLVGSNGYLTFGPDGTFFSNQPIPSTSEPNDLIAPLWDDWRTDSGGSLRFATLLGPTRFVASWEAVTAFGDVNTRATFQAVLFEDGRIEFRYGDFDPSSPSIGVENAVGVVGTSISPASIEPDAGECRELIFVEGEDVADPTDNVGQIGKKGSLLIFPKVEIRVDAAGATTFDTFLSVTNDGGHAVNLKLWFVNGDDWCYFVDDTGLLTPNNPIYWSADTGAPGPTAGGGGAFQSFRFTEEPGGLDDGLLRGFIVAYATSPDEFPVCWNHLSGKATLVDYLTGDAYEYSATAFAGLGDDCDENEEALPLEDLVARDAGALILDGFDYDQAPDAMLMDFFADDAAAPVLGESGVNGLTAIATELTILLLDIDFTSQTAATVASLEHRIYNENEQHRTFSGEDCIQCWSSRIISTIVNQYGRLSLGTDKGKSRIDSREGRWCPIRYCHVDPNLPTQVFTIDRALLAVQTTFLSFAGGTSGAAASPTGIGVQSANEPAFIRFRAQEFGIPELVDIREPLNDE